jgi:hypothetical protein
VLDEWDFDAAFEFGLSIILAGLNRPRFVRLDCHDLTVDSAPVCAKIETAGHLAA